MKGKIVIIGSGSQFTGFFLQELFKHKDLKGITLALVDRRPDRLKHEVKLAKFLNDIVNWDVIVEGYTDRKEALRGATHICCYIAVNQIETWKKEFQIANKHGIYPMEGYTAGPPSLGFAIRHIPPVLDICKDIEEICPDAYLILENNPLAKIISAVYRYTKVKAIGYCYGHILEQMAVEQILDMNKKDPSKYKASMVEREYMVPVGNVDITTSGINHLQWVMDMRSTETGEDLYPLFRERINDSKNIPDGYLFSAEVCKMFGLFPSPGDSQVADYLWFVDIDVQKKYGLKPFPVDSWHGNRDENAWEKIASENSDEKSAKEFIGSRFSGYRNIDITRYLMSGGKNYFPAVNVINNGLISNLNDDIVVEVPAVIGGGMIRPIKMGALPEPMASFCDLHGRITNLIADAAVMGSKKIALEALSLDPFVPNIITARKLLDDILKYNKKYDTRFK